MEVKRNFILVYADGACSGNPGPGGWGAIIAYQNDYVEEIGGFAPETTNNQMEMTAVGSALRVLEKHPGDLVVRTDSQYVVKGMTEWMSGWRKKNWKKASGDPVLNVKFWQRLNELIEERLQQGYKVQWEYVKGHSGDPGNDRCDTIAVSFSKKKNVDLYKGPLAQYPIDIEF